MLKQKFSMSRFCLGENRAIFLAAGPENDNLVTRLDQQEGENGIVDNMNAKRVHEEAIIATAKEIDNQSARLDPSQRERVLNELKAIDTKYDAIASNIPNYAKHVDELATIKQNYANQNQGTETGADRFATVSADALKGKKDVVKGIIESHSSYALGKWRDINSKIAKDVFNLSLSNEADSIEFGKMIQAKLGVVVDGKIGPETMRALLRELNISGVVVESAQMSGSGKAETTSATPNVGGASATLETAPDFTRGEKIQNYSQGLERMLALAEDSKRTFEKDLKQGNLFEWALGGSKEAYQKGLAQQLSTILQTLNKLRAVLGGNTNDPLYREHYQKYNALLQRYSALSGQKIEGVSGLQALGNSTVEAGKNILNGESLKVLWNYSAGALEGAAHGIITMLDPRTWWAIVEGVGKALGTVATITYELAAGNMTLAELGAKQQKMAIAIGNKLAALGSEFANAPPDQQSQMLGKVVGEVAGMMVGGVAAARVAAEAKTVFNATRLATKGERVQAAGSAAKQAGRRALEDARALPAREAEAFRYRRAQARHPVEYFRQRSAARVAEKTLKQDSKLAQSERAATSGEVASAERELAKAKEALAKQGREKVAGRTEAEIREARAKLTERVAEAERKAVEAQQKLTTAEEALNGAAERGVQASREMRERVIAIRDIKKGHGKIKKQIGEKKAELKQAESAYERELSKLKQQGDKMTVEEMLSGKPAELTTKRAELLKSFQRKQLSIHKEIQSAEVELKSVEQKLKGLREGGPVESSATQSVESLPSSANGAEAVVRIESNFAKGDQVVIQRTPSGKEIRAKIVEINPDGSIIVKTSRKAPPQNISAEKLRELNSTTRGANIQKRIDQLNQEFDAAHAAGDADKANRTFEELQTLKSELPAGRARARAEVRTWEDFSVGETVSVPRTSGGITSGAEVIEIMPNGKVRVKFQEGGELLEKEVGVNAMRRVNPEKFKSAPAREIGAKSSELASAEESLARSRMAESASKPRRNPERKPYAEVVRDTDVISIGDLHGDLAAFEKTLFDHKLIDANGRWIGGNKKIVQTGDIFDRGAEGTKILNRVTELRNQGADIKLLIGNHEDWMIRGMLGDNKALMNWARYAEDEFPQVVKMIEQGNLRSARAELMKLQNSFKNMKVIEQVDDVLYLHAELSPELAQAIKKYGIDGINQRYSQALEKAFKEGGSSQEFMSVADEFSEIFWSRNVSGKKLTPNELSEITGVLKNNGVNVVVHGHTPLNAPAVTELNGVKIINGDSAMSRGMRDGSETVQSGGVNIQQSGGMNIPAAA